MKKATYEERLAPLQLELENLAHWLRHTRQRIVVLLEGRDAAGKGGCIGAITERLNPRQVRVVALDTPSERERTQWYFQRYIAHLPAGGELVLFDRSWYSRAGVEKVMGFCTGGEYERFLDQAPKFEKRLVEDGILLYKYWLAVDQREQEKRFVERARDPLKRWKLSPVDLEARRRYVEYGRARDAMFEATHTRHASWHVVEFDDQRRGRLNLIDHFLGQVPYRRLKNPPVKLPRLRGGPAKERYKGPVKPIKGRF